MATSFLNGTEAAFRDSGTEWMIFACLEAYFLIFLLVRSRSNPGFWMATNPNLWIAGTQIIGAIVYAIDYSPSFKALIFLGGAVLGQGAAFLKGRRWNSLPNNLGEVTNVETRSRFVVAIVTFFVVLLTLASIWNARGGNFEYHKHLRWNGPWDNPNIYGGLMGVGAVLSLGFVWKTWNKTANAPWRRHLVTSIWLAGAIVCGVGLIKSYSRGAWLATLAGLCYLAYEKKKFSQFSAVFLPGPANADSSSVPKRSCIRYNDWRTLAVILASLLVFSFWQFRFTEWLPVRRLFSVANINDFSWRNRVVAWRGAIHMMTERPWLGFGWEQAETIYKKKYSPPQLDDGLAIRTNDYFMLGIATGIPAFICFVVYAGLSLKKRLPILEAERLGVDLDNGFSTRLQNLLKLEWAEAVCRTAALVLLVSFWFDGGLFKLGTGSVFWILLELGSADTGRISYPHKTLAIIEEQKLRAKRISESCRGSRLETLSRRTAWILATLAFLQTITLIGTLSLGVNNATLAIARRWLIPREAIGDLDFLAIDPVLRGRKVRILLEHVSLANYNRQLLSWKLDDGVYREYVLEPTIDPKRDGEIDWRRGCWEYFYPLIRRETDPGEAAKIVEKYLRDCVTIVPTGPLTIEEMWKERKADANGFEALKVAAFRAVGVPARLTDESHAELFADGKWREI
ncbi:MAG TPA: O-antigen ligase family protein [Verrucomicrobiae bacterium]|nr:O-antigen ligase family protein [Verrucomicrobiae bacterium]